MILLLNATNRPIQHQEFRSNFQSELIRVAEVAISEPVKKGKAGYAVKATR
jgi:hypothetical protein